MVSEYEDQEFRRFLEDLGRSAKNTGRSALRGAVAGVLGLPGDMLSLVRQPDPYAPEEEPRLFTFEGMSRQLADTYPRAMGYEGAEPSPQERVAEFIGSLASPGPDEAVRGAREGAAALAAGAPAVVAAFRKPGQHNWVLDPRVAYDEPEHRSMSRAQHEILQNLDDVHPMSRNERFDQIRDELIAPFEKRLLKWRQKYLGTTEDPIKQLADSYQDGVIMPHLVEGGALEMRNTDDWEGLWDYYGDSILHDLGDLRQGRSASLELDRELNKPWLVGLPDSEKVLALDSDSNEALSRTYAHMADVLAQNPRVNDPEFWKNLTPQKAFKLMFDFDEQQAAAMKKAVAQRSAKGVTPIKQYDDGAAWVRIDGGEITEADIAEHGSTDQALERLKNDRIKQALKDEGDIMGHCVGGYCDQVIRGDTEIYSLRDPNGAAHVTVEVNPPDWGDGWPAKEIPDPTDQFNTFHDLINAVRKGNGDYNKVANELARKYDIIPPGATVSQIKGKQNRQPTERYLNQVVDFLNSKEWSVVNDLPSGVVDLTKSLGLAFGAYTKIYPELLPEIERQGRVANLNPAKIKKIALSKLGPNRFVIESEFEAAVIEAFKELNGL